jgi:hypothetical protein
MDRRLDRFAEMKVVLANGKAQLGILLVELQRILEYSQTPLCMAIADQLGPLLDELRELLALRAAISRYDECTTLIEPFAFDGLLVMPRYPILPSLLELVSVDGMHLSQHFGQSLEHHVIVEATSGLLLRELEQLLKTLVCASYRSFERTDPLEQMLLKGVVSEVSEPRASCGS